jgi:hypothetical protein
VRPVIERRDVFRAGGAAAMFIASTMSACASADTDDAVSVSQADAKTRSNAIALAISQFNANRGEQPFGEQLRFLLHRNASRTSLKLIGDHHFAGISFAEVFVESKGIAPDSVKALYSGTQYLRFTFDAGNKIKSVGMV